jgi:hypothetical protein
VAGRISVKFGTGGVAQKCDTDQILVEIIQQQAWKMHSVPEFTDFPHALFAVRIYNY